MAKAVCEDCGAVVTAELTHNGICRVGHYVHCGWGHELSPDDLLSDAEAIEIMTEQLESARADAKEAEAYAKELEAKLAKAEARSEVLETLIMDVADDLYDGVAAHKIDQRIMDVINKLNDEEEEDQ